MEYNKYYKWEDLVKQYPDMWVFYDVNKSKEKDGVLDTVFVLSICSFQEKYGYIVKYRKSGLRFNCKRTVENLPIVGVIL